MLFWLDVVCSMVILRQQTRESNESNYMGEVTVDIC